MKIGKIVFATGTLLLLAIAIWMQVSHFSARGGWVDGRWENNTITPGAAFFFAAVLAGMYFTVIVIERKQKNLLIVTIPDIIEKLSADASSYGITLFPPASLQQLIDFENRLNCPLPDDLKTLYLFCNGFESAEDIFRIVPLDEITGRLADYKPNSFDFAEYMTYCDMWRIEINPANPNDYNISNQGDVFRPLTPSLAEFLDRFLAGGVFGEGGLYEWHKEVDAQQ